MGYSGTFSKSKYYSSHYCHLLHIKAYWATIQAMLTSESYLHNPPESMTADERILVRSIRSQLPYSSDPLGWIPTRHPIPVVVISSLSVQVNEIFFTRSTRHPSKRLLTEHRIFIMIMAMLHHFIQILNLLNNVWLTCFSKSFNAFLVSFLSAIFLLSPDTMASSLSRMLSTLLLILTLQFL